MTLYRSLNNESPFHMKSTPCLRKEIFFYESKFSTEKILDILINVDVQKYIPALRRITLLNLITDLSIEPIASQIIDDLRFED